MRAAAEVMHEPASFSLRELPTRAKELAYVAQQLSMFVPAGLAQRALRRVTGETGIEPTPQQLDILMRRYRALLARDVENVREGLYPDSLLFQIPALHYAKRLPWIVRDLPGVVRRRARENYRDLDAREARRYPAYFRRTFHWQTDGYLYEDWHMSPNPFWEEITLAVPGRCWVGSVIIDTRCYPAPGTAVFALCAMGAVAARRRRS